MEISEIGLRAALDKLFNESGYINQLLFKNTSNSNSCAVHLTLMEAVDFDLSYNPLRHLGYKAVSKILGQIYANYYKPNSISVVL